MSGCLSERVKPTLIQWSPNASLPVCSPTLLQPGNREATQRPLQRHRQHRSPSRSRLGARPPSSDHREPGQPLPVVRSWAERRAPIGYPLCHGIRGPSPSAWLGSNSPNPNGVIGGVWAHIADDAIDKAVAGRGRVTPDPCHFHHAIRSLKGDGMSSHSDGIGVPGPRAEPPVPLGSGGSRTGVGLAHLVQVGFDMQRGSGDGREYGVRVDRDCEPDDFALSSRETASGDRDEALDLAAPGCPAGQRNRDEGALGRAVREQQMYLVGEDASGAGVVARDDDADAGVRDRRRRVVGHGGGDGGAGAARNEGRRKLGHNRGRTPVSGSPWAITTWSDCPVEPSIAWTSQATSPLDAWYLTVTTPETSVMATVPGGGFRDPHWPGEPSFVSLRKVTSSPPTGAPLGRRRSR